MRLLITAKTITIERVLELVPVGTVDPTPFLYDTTCDAAAGLMGVAALSNLAIRPLDLKKENRESIQCKNATRECVLCMSSKIDQFGNVALVHLFRWICNVIMSSWIERWESSLQTYHIYVFAGGIEQIKLRAGHSKSCQNIFYGCFNQSSPPCSLHTDF
jgi:hypothetical protein